MLDVQKNLSTMRLVFFFSVVFILFIESIEGSFWNEIPPRCFYDRRRLFACTNTTFIQPIPLLNDRLYTFEQQHVDLRQSSFQLTLRDLFLHVATQIENLTLIDNEFSSIAIEGNRIFEGGLFFRLLLSLKVQDDRAMQWTQLNGSYFPQLIELDLSHNFFTDHIGLVFDQEHFSQLKSLNLSSNQLKTLTNLRGNRLTRLERLILSSNPLESLDDNFHQFSSLIELDLSSCPIKRLIPLEYLPSLRSFHCQQCRHLPSWEYEKFLVNCSQLDLDLTHSNVHSMKFLNPSMKCLRTLILNEHNLVGSISTNDFLLATNLERLEGRNNGALELLHLNVYEHLQTIDFSSNPSLEQVILRLRSNSTQHLKVLNFSRTILNDFSIDFYQNPLKYFHIDQIDLSHGRLETIEFIKYLTFSTLDLSFNRLKIVDIDRIHFRHGMYNLALMNLFNLSNNQMEFVQIHWENESPHLIDLSENRLESVELHGQTTYSLNLKKNFNLSLTPTTIQLDLPPLQTLDLTSIDLRSFEHLIYLHNLSAIRMLTLDNNRLAKDHRTLNWQIFYPWHQYLTHLAMRNMSIERLDATAHLDDFLHLLTIDLDENFRLKCDCTLQGFISWFKRPPVPLNDLYEPLQKTLRIDCPMPLFDLHCSNDDDVQSNESHRSLVAHWRFIRTVFILLVFAMILFAMLKLADRYLKSVRSRFYRQVYTNGDFITLNERHLYSKPSDE